MKRNDKALSRKSEVFNFGNKVGAKNNSFFPKYDFHIVANMSPRTHFRRGGQVSAKLKLIARSKFNEYSHNIAWNLFPQGRAFDRGVGNISCTPN